MNKAKAPRQYAGFIISRESIDHTCELLYEDGRTCYIDGRACRYADKRNCYDWRTYRVTHLKSRH